jgi:hypothetical protein
MASGSPPPGTEGVANFLFRDVWAMLTVAVGLDFFGTEEADDDTGCLEIGAAFPPEAVHSLSDAGLGQPRLARVPRSSRGACR